MCKLITPNKKYLEGNTEYIKELFNIGEITQEELDSKIILRQDADAFLASLNKTVEGVEVHTYWLVDKDRFIGTLRLNKKLNEQLKKGGGNVGYEIRPSEYGKGYGTKILELGIERAKELGMKEILIDCREDNEASRKIIEKNGGKFIESKIDESGGPKSLKYRISL